MSPLSLHTARIKISLERTPSGNWPTDGASAVSKPRRAGRPGEETAVERREAQRARSRRFAQADCPVARAAPEARASGNIRPRGAATTLAPPGAALPASVGEEFLTVASMAKPRALRRAARTKSLTSFQEVSMTQLGRRFGLSEMPGSGVSCGKDGLFVGEVPLLCKPPVRWLWAVAAAPDGRSQSRS